MFVRLPGSSAINSVCLNGLEDRLGYSTLFCMVPVAWSETGLGLSRTQMEDYPSIVELKNRLGSWEIRPGRRL